MTRTRQEEQQLMITMYSTTWCGYCHRLKSQLDREGIQFQVVDIERDPAAAKYVESVNGGNQTVPTVRFDDGTAMTNPTIVQVKAKLAEAVRS
ncbi:mycoredoxin [Dactylosporangium roseum]